MGQQAQDNDQPRRSAVGHAVRSNGERCRPGRAPGATNKRQADRSASSRSCAGASRSRLSIEHYLSDDSAFCWPFAATRGVRACALAWRQTRSTRWRMLVFAESETGAQSWSTGAGTYAGPGRRMQAQVDAESAADLAHSSQQRSEGRRADRRLGPRLETEAIVRMTRHFAAPASANAGCRCSRSRDRGSPAAAPPVATEPVRRGRRLMTGVSHWASPAGLGRDDSVVDRGAASQPEMETRRLVELVDAYAR